MRNAGSTDFMYEVAQKNSTVVVSMMFHVKHRTLYHGEVVQFRV